jgi:hypothetical protein
LLLAKELVPPSFRQFAYSTHEGVGLVVKRLISSSIAVLVAVSLFAGTALADPTPNQAPKRKQEVQERTVFVTGSLIPQRVKLRPIGTTTVSPIRIIDRHEIDWTGRHTTPGAFINEPSVRIIGH